MSSLQLVCLILLLNLAVTLVYALAMALARSRARWWQNALVMLLCPGVGPVFFLGSAVAFRLFRLDKEIDRESVSFSRSKKQFVFAPDEEEKHLVPIEESLLISAHTDRRRAFLKSLQLDVSKNIALFTRALDNDDAETSHYSASILMEASAKFQSSLQRMAVEYDKNREDAAINLEYAQAAFEYYDSNILSDIEKQRYAHLYMNLMDNYRQNHAEELTPEQCERTVAVMLAMREYPRALEWALDALARFPLVESAHLSLANAYYSSGDVPGFLSTLSRLRESPVQLSRKGDALLRLFTVPEAAARAQGAAPS